MFEYLTQVRKRRGGGVRLVNSCVDLVALHNLLRFENRYPTSLSLSLQVIFPEPPLQFFYLASSAL